MNEPRVRRAIREDAERLVAVYRSTYRENRALGVPAKAETATEADIHDWLDAGRVVVAEIDGQEVGAIRIEDTSPERVKVSRLSVHEDWKRSSIGSALLDHVGALARAGGYETTRLTTPGDHPYPPAFYRDRGYRTIRDQPLE